MGRKRACGPPMRSIPRFESGSGSACTIDWGHGDVLIESCRRMLLSPTGSRRAWLGVSVYGFYEISGDETRPLSKLDAVCSYKRTLGTVSSYLGEISVD